MGFRVVPNACGSGGSATAAYTKTEVDNLLNGKVSKTGDTMTGNLVFASAANGVVEQDSSGVNWRSGVRTDGAPTTTSI